MRKLLIASWVLVCCPVMLFARRADDAPNPQGLIEKAIKAMGGEEKMSRFKAVTFKTKGKFSGFGQPVEFTGDFSIELPNKRKAVTKFDISGMLRSTTMVVNGDKGWMHQRGRVQDMPPAMLAQQKDELYAAWAATVLPLKDPACKLSAIPAATVNEQAALGIRASHERHPDLTLYFAKDSGLLIKSVSHSKGRDGKESMMETYYSDYKDVDGVMVYTKLTVKRDGKEFAQTEFSDFNLMEKLDDKVFEKPPDE